MTGAASSVGHYITQIAKLRGARVIGTASPERQTHARTAGVDELIDYRNEDVGERIRKLTGGRGVDGIIDMDLSSTVGLLPKGALAANGKLVCYGSNVVTEIPLAFGPMLWGSLTLQFFLVYELRAEERAAAIAALNDMLEAGSLTHPIGASFSLADLAAAHEAVEAGGLAGNVVVKI